MPVTLTPEATGQKPPRKKKSASKYVVMKYEDVVNLQAFPSMKAAQESLEVEDMPDGAFSILCIRAKIITSTETSKKITVAKG